MYIGRNLEYHIGDKVESEGCVILGGGYPKVLNVSLAICLVVTWDWQTALSPTILSSD